MSLCPRDKLEGRCDGFRFHRRDMHLEAFEHDKSAVRYWSEVVSIIETESFVPEDTGIENWD